MNCINFLSNNNSAYNESPSERIKSKENFYHISDSLKSNKLAFAFFLDKYSVRASDEQGVKEVKALSSYEWFAGSLTAEQFAKELKGFIASPHSSTLKPELKQKLEEFASILENSNDQGYLIDLVRSTDLRLIFLILTGIVIGESKIEVGNEKIQEISSETLKQIKSLKEGEKRIFLVGSVLHETRLTVERKKEGWEVCYFDSTKGEFPTYQCTESSPLLTPAFWDKIYSLKFSPSFVTTPGQTPRTMITLNELETHISSIGKMVDSQHDPEASIKRQNRNTCHFEGLLAALKKEIICAQSPHSADAVMDWKEFKVTFGDYLLEDKKLNATIKKQALKQQEHRVERTNHMALFASMIKQGKYNETVECYVEAIKKVRPDFEMYALDSKLQKLASLDSRLRSYLNLYLVSPEEMQSLLGTIENPCVVSTFNTYKNRFPIKQQELEKQVENELKAASSHFDVLIESAQEKFNETVNNLLGKEKALWNFSFNFDYVPLGEKQIEKYLSIFSNRPELLLHLDQRPAFMLILMQSIQVGKMDSIKHLYDSLSNKDKTTFQQALERFTAADALDGSKLHPRLLPKSVLEFYLSNSNHAISKMLAPLLMDQAIREGSLTNLYALVRQDPHLINHMSPEKMRRMKLSIEQIEAFFALAAADADHQGAVNLRDPYFNNLLFCIIKKFFELSRFDLFLKIPPKMEKFFSKFESLAILTEENLRIAQGFNAQYPRHFMHKFFETNICANQYRQGTFSNNLARITACPLDKEFKTEFNENNFNEGLKFLGNCNCRDVFNRCLEDLILYASSHSSTTKMQDVLFALEKIKPNGQQFLLEFTSDLASHLNKKESMYVRIVLLETILEGKEVNQEFFNNLLKVIFFSLEENTFVQVQNLVEKLEKKQIKIDSSLLIGGYNIKLVQKFSQTPLAKMIVQANLQKTARGLIEKNKDLQKPISEDLKKEIEFGRQIAEKYFMNYWKILSETGGGIEENKVVDLIQEILPEAKAYDREYLQKIFQFVNKE
jgi:hypothetical protein